jgi:NUP50 (Nucleoporin 50 kDa)
MMLSCNAFIEPELKMAKRGADKYLTDQNWDKEEEEQEQEVWIYAGLFVHHLQYVDYHRSHKVCHMAALGWGCHENYCFHFISCCSLRCF